MQATKGTQKGVDDTVNAVSEIMGGSINYYVETNYWGFQVIVDALGGIDLNFIFKTNYFFNRIPTLSTC